MDTSNKWIVFSLCIQTPIHCPTVFKQLQQSSQSLSNNYNNQPKENLGQNNHWTINCDKCSLWIHIKCSKISKQTYIYLMHENSHWYCMLCTQTFLPYSFLNYNEFKKRVIGKQVKFTYIAKPAISNTENFIKAINSQNNITKYFPIKDLNSTFKDIGSPFFLFHLNINSLSFHFDELESLMSKSKNDFQIIGISEIRLKKTQD